MQNKIILTDCDGVLLNWEWAFLTWLKFKGIVAQDAVIDPFKYNMEDRFEFGGSGAHTKYREDVTMRQLVTEFNNSAAIGFLPALRDAVEWVGKLSDEGWRFVVISSLSTNPYAIQLRKDNLTKLFGNIFNEIICLDTAADKTFELSKYQGSGFYWIEDKTENAEIGVKLGLKSIIMEHGHNMDFKDTRDYDNIQIVKNWMEIYHIMQPF